MGESGAARSRASVWARIRDWILLDCDRTVLATAMLIAIFLTTYGLIWAGAITVKASSVAGASFGSGAVAGLFTLITVVLSINQLILSRVFGSPRGLRNEYEASLDIRSSVAEITDEHRLPNDPMQFLAVIGQSMQDQARRIERDGRDESRGDVNAYVSALTDYGDVLRNVGTNTRPTSGLTDLLGGDYANLIAETERIKRRYGSDTGSEIDAISDLLEAAAITRQYFKTMTIQQNLAKLSRQIAISGLIALLTAFYVAFVYRTKPNATIDPTLLPWIASGGLTVVVSPVVVLLVHIFRISTIMWYTVSVGPFVRPEQ